jgi:hypothetical protein
MYELARLGQPQKDKPVEIILGPATLEWKLPRLHCTTTQLAKVSAIMGRPMTRAEIRSEILKLGEKGRHLANQAWFKLHDKKLPPAVEQQFKSMFGVASTSRPVGGGSTMQRIVVVRYEGALRKLSDNDVHVSCWGWPWGGAPADNPEKYLTSTAQGRHGIALGKQFWVAVRDGDSMTAAAALLGAALHLFYYRIGFNPSAPRTVRAACYQRFAILAAGETVPAWIEQRCAA